MAVVALYMLALGQRWANHWLLLLSIDLDTFYDISNKTGLYLSLFGGLTSSHVFSPPLPWLPTTPKPTFPMQALVVLMKNYLKWRAIQLATH